MIKGIVQFMKMEKCSSGIQGLKIFRDQHNTGLNMFYLEQFTICMYYSTCIYVGI